MFSYILRKVFGTKNDRELKRLWKYVSAINQFWEEYQNLSDSELRAKTDEFRSRLEKGETEDEILHEAFAVVKEAAKRGFSNPEIAEKLFGDPNQRRFGPHFDVQLIGGVVLHDGKIVEMSTGEGKTLVATLSAYLNALSGKGVHIVTVNDFLAKRDAAWMGEVYKFLGLSVGFIQHDMNPQERQIAYGADITYGTNNEFGFDYLRDNMVVRKEDKAQRGLNYAVVDEVDSILIDEARTPLIISGPAEESTDKYYKLEQIFLRLKEGIRNEETKQETGDYVKDEKAHTTYLTEEGEMKVAKLLGLEDLHTLETMEYKHHAEQMLKAHCNFQRDKDYMVKDGQVIIVDEFTGRIMPGRRYSDGLHQALEAKERVKIEQESQTLATVTFQNYFRMYKKLAGMTGTAETEAVEFHKIYNLEVVVIPPNKVLKRTNYPDVIYKTEKEKFKAIIQEIKELYKLGRPVLVGTISIEKSEVLDQMLKKERIPHEVLNAKYHEKEAKIIEKAGQAKAVTIATNMAGRGTDIVLGEGVAERGGLHILGTERHESRRIDNQLRGRAGRQGDPGSSRFYLSFDDDLMRIFGSDRIKGLMERMGMPDGQPIEHRMVTKAIENAQKRVEGRNFDIRKDLLKYDDVMNKQREVIYQQRDMVLEGKKLEDYVSDMINEIVEKRLSIYTPKNIHPEEWDLDGLSAWLRQSTGVSFNRNEVDPAKIEYQDLKNSLVSRIKAAYKAKRSAIILQAEQAIMLHVIDAKWKDLLYAMDTLREGIGYQAYGQKDPLVEYKREGFNMFYEMIESIEEEIIEYFLKVQVGDEAIHMREVFDASSQHLSHEQAKDMRHLSQRQMPQQQEMSTNQPEGEAPREPYKREEKKIGRNESCPCGSGKKYKKCCGANV
ncbi:MAG: preprotein translocase subunit SecA [bacterium]|nr:preprotein translocase subunit SecA [bacterium]